MNRQESALRSTNTRPKWILRLLFVAMVVCLSRSQLFANQFAPVAQFEPERGTWIIGNESIRAEYRFDPSAGAVQLMSLRNLKNSVEWAGSSDHPLFRFTYSDGNSQEQTVDSRAGWRLEDRKVNPPTDLGREIVVRLLHAASGMEVELHAECAAGYPVVRQWYAIVNRSGHPRTLIDASIVSDPIRWSGPTDVLTYRFEIDGAVLTAGPPDIQSLSSLGAEKKTGNIDYSPMMILRARSSSSGLFWGWAYSGPSFFSIAPDEKGQSGLFQVNFLPKKPGSRRNLLSYQLGAGERFDVPRQFVGVFQGDWDDATFLSQRHADRFYSGAQTKKQRLPLIFVDSWGAYKLQEDNLRRIVDHASQLGIEAMDIDYGWAVNGDWKPEQQLFPSGLRAFTQYAHKRGIKVIVHLPFGNVDHESEIYKLHPEWTYAVPTVLWKDENGRQMIASAICLTNEEARNWMLERVANTLQENGLDGFDLDGQLFGKDNVPCKVRTGSAGKAAPEYSQYIFGLYPLLERLTKQVPGLVIENAGGPMGAPVYDYANAEWFQHTISNVSIPSGRRMLEFVRIPYNITYVMSPGWSAQYYPVGPKDEYHKADQHEGKKVKDAGFLRLNEFCLRTALIGGPFYFELDPQKLTPSQEKLVAKYVRMFKAIRPWVSTGKVLHLMPPSESKDWNGWSALGVYSPEQDRAIVVGWNFQGRNKSMTIPMKALRPEGVYEISFASGRKYTAQGSDVMGKGLSLSLDPYADDTTSHSSEVIFINPVKEVHP